VYPAFSWNRDEPVYLWQVDLLRSGRLTGADGGFPELLHPWLSAWRDGEFFTQYPLGWPVVILLGALVAWPGAAISIAAVLAVTGVGALTTELGHDRVVANAAALVMLSSPIFVVQGGLYLNYLFTLGLGLWFLTLFLGSVRLESPWRAIGAAVAFGWIVCTRTFDAVLWGAVALGYVALIERRTWRRHVPTAGWFLGAVVPFVVLQLLHNRALTGSLLTFPITAKDPLDTFGFGYRRLMPAFESEGYGLRRAVTSTAKHGFFLPWFLFGAYLGVVVAGVAAWLRRHDRSTWLLVALVAVFPLGYLAFWGTYVSSLTVRLSGPIYFVPLYAPLAILTAVGLVHLRRRHARLGLALLVVLAAVTVPITWGRLGLNRELSRAQIAWRDSVDGIDEPAVVVVAATAYLLYLNPYSANTAEVGGDIIYATNAWPSLIDLLDQHPDRVHYIQRSTLAPEDMLPSEHPQRPEIVLTPLEIIHGDAVGVTLRIVPPRTGEEVWALVEFEGTPHWRRVTNDSVAGTEIVTTWTVATPDSAPEVLDHPDTIVVPKGALSISFGATFGSATRQVRLTPLVRHRVHVRTTDGVEVLVPGVTFRGRETAGVRFPDRWDELLEVPELAVEVHLLDP
jgi:hypothetical protein